MLFLHLCIDIFCVSHYKDKYCITIRYLSRVWATNGPEQNTPSLDPVVEATYTRIRIHFYYHLCCLVAQAPFRLVAAEDAGGVGFAIGCVDRTVP